MAFDFSDPTNPTFTVDDSENDLVDLASLEIDLQNPLNGVVLDPSDLTGLSAAGPLDDPGTEIIANFTGPLNAAQQTAFIAVVQAHDGEPFVGEIFQKWESNPPQLIANGTDWTEIFSRTSKKLAEGLYRIDYNVEGKLEVGDLGTKLRVRARVNGGVQAAWTWRPDEDSYDNKGGWDFRSFNNGDRPVFSIEARTQNGTDSGTIKRIKIGLQKVVEE